MLGTLFLVSFSVLFSSQNAFATCSFPDDFSDDPALNGWTKSIVGGTGTITSDGSEVKFTKTSPPPAFLIGITKTISTVGCENMQLRLTAYQSLDAWEEKDFLEIRIDTNNDGDFEHVLRDVNRWDGIEDQNPNDNGDLANTAPTSTDLLHLPDAADNNPALKIQIQGRFDSTSESYFLTNLEVIGDPIQNNNVIGGNILEIDSYALLVSGVSTNPVIVGLIGFALAGIGLIITRRERIFS